VSPTFSPAHRGDLAELGAITAIIDAALAEDLGAGDLTARLTVPIHTRARARIIARQTLVFSGAPIAARVFARVDPDLEVEVGCAEGTLVEPGTELMRISGDGRSLLAAERTVLNLLGRACAVSTSTRRYVEAAGPSGLRVVDTRKTMPGLRALDRYAVRQGGGHNHRNDLGSGVLIKENHIRCAGSVTEAVAMACAHAPHSVRVECEVETLAEVREAIVAGADTLLLDNMSDDQLRAAAALAAELGGGTRKVLLEVSGGVTLERLPALGELDVDLVSVGALTHSAPNVDLSMLFTVSS